jgi:shikimate 5-dehydrogenase
MKKIHDRINPGVPVEYIIASEASINDAVVCGLRPGSLVVNATGLGKDREGSPLTDNAQFPDHGIVWEFNYRGNLIFLEQARRQASSRSLRIEDGWRYFINGWLSVIAEVLQIDLPLSGQLYDELSAIASQYR